MEGARPDDRIRLAELMAALSLATDLGLGRPLEHELGVCLAALELAERLGLAAEERSEVYYVALLAHVGCTGAAADFASWAGGDDIHLAQGLRGVGLSSGPAEDLRHFVRHLADDRPLPERGRLLARMLAGGARAGALMAANLCEGATVLARRLLHAGGGGARARPAAGALGRQGAARDRGGRGDRAADADRLRGP